MLPGHRAWPAGQRVVGGGVRHSTDARGMVALHIVALLLTLLGSLVVTHEVWSGRRRWVATFGTTRPSSGEVSGVVSVRSTAWGSVGLVGETVEARLAALEERQQKDHMALVTRIMGVEQKMPDVAADAAREVENRLRPQIADVLAYLTGQRATGVVAALVGWACVAAGRCAAFRGRKCHRGRQRLLTRSVGGPVLRCAP